MNPLDEYNPEQYDEDEIGTDDGWRCLVLAETVVGRELPSDLEYYDDDDGEWKESGCAGMVWIDAFGGITYRTQADLPAIPIATPLPIDDPLSVILKMVNS